MYSDRKATGSGAQMEFPYMRCPNCGSTTFYVNLPEGGMFFFHVMPDGAIVSTRDADVKIDEIDFSVIYCTSCGWYGRLDELAA